MAKPSLTNLPVSIILLALSCLPAQRPAADDGPSYEREIRPILKTHCFHCHGEGNVKPKSGLDLRLRRFILAGGKKGPAIVDGHKEKSPLFIRVHSHEMPPGDDVDKLTPTQIKLIGKWIDQGAQTLREEPTHIDNTYIPQEEREFWAFQPVNQPSIPQVYSHRHIRNPIDNFIQSRLEKDGFELGPDAQKRTIIRRLFFDLTGLPPQPNDSDTFLADPRSDAYEQLIDRLLDSDSYGEKWARHWLDVAGYADSEGYDNDDRERLWAWKYRDYVIRSFNSDKPFNEFIVEQLAGDELLKPPYKNLAPDDIDYLVATGFLRMAPDGTVGANESATVARNDVVAKTMEIVSTSLLGLTVACAQCHNHRYDPIPQADYYRLRAIFEPGFNTAKWKTPPARLVSLYTDADKAQAAKIEAEAKAILAKRTTKQNEFITATYEKELAKLPEEIRETVRVAHDKPTKERSPEEIALLKKHPSVNVTAGSLYLYDSKAAAALKKLADEAAAVRARRKTEEFVRALTETPGVVPTTHLFFRGDPEQPKELLTPGELSVLTTSMTIPENRESLPTTGRRLAYARHLTSGSHPLVARVLVNRVWAHYFGRGIVATLGDFGVLGDRPSHPELLDWLAAEFVANKWSMKWLHRQIVSSTTYRQSTNRPDRLTLHDPDNILLGGMNLRRLDAEVIRDTVLAISGQLNRKKYGKPVPVMANLVGKYVIGKENLNAGRPGPVLAMNREDLRRSVYVQVRRSRPLAVLSTFDAPPMTPNCTQRRNSTVTTQSLMLMNSEFTLNYSRHFATQLKTRAGADTEQQIKLAWKLAYGRLPSTTELEESIEYFQSQTLLLDERKKNGDKSLAKIDTKHEALSSICQLLISSNEFLYVD